jgi:hypothetical protein
MTTEFVLTAENYHSKDANLRFMGTGQYKDWLKCEASTFNWLQSGCPSEDTDALMVGRYVHKWSEGPEAFECFKSINSSYIYNKKGEPYAAFKKADEMIDILQEDPKVMFYLSGSCEVILTAPLFGVPWKIMIDIDNPELNYLLDLKTTKSITETSWSVEQHCRVSFIEEWNYMIQAAIYSEVERLARGREDCRDFYIAAVSKERTPDHSIIDLTDPERMATELGKIEQALPRILAVKSGEEPPVRCEKCDYCKATKRIDRVINYKELMPA